MKTCVVDFLDVRQEMIIRFHVLSSSELEDKVKDVVFFFVRNGKFWQQYQKTQVQSSELRPYLARFRFNLASLRRFNIN